MKQKTLQKYLKIRKETVMTLDTAPYKWYRLEGSLTTRMFIYSEFLDEHARELANSINELRERILSIATWEKVFNDLNSNEKHEALIEFVSPIATLALLMPYVIRSRFIFSVTHLSHQANMACQFSEISEKDDLPADNKIYFGDADKYANTWKKYNKFKVELENIANNKFDSITKDFRNKYNHRYSPRIEIGITNLVKRNINKSSQVSYGIGGDQPLLLKDILPALITQHKNSLKAFKKYQDVVNEQISEMNKILKITGS